MITEYLNDLLLYHVNNLYGLESDPTKHEEYWRNALYDLNQEDLTYEYKKLMEQAGSWNSNQIGKMNAVIWLLNDKYPNWRENGNY